MTRPQILVTDEVDTSALPILEEVGDVIYEAKLSAEELLTKIKTVNALMIRSASKVTAAVLEAAPNLQMVGRAGVGTDNVDLQAATRRGVIVVNSPEGNTVAAAEHTVGLLFALARHIPEADASLKQGEWKRKHLTGVELFGKTLGVVGLGKIGGRVAKVCQAIGMKVMVFDPFLSTEAAERLGVKSVALEDIWANADFITVHAPKTKETTNLLNKETLAKCKPGVRLVNCARGGIFNEADIIEAVNAGHVAAVGLDVFEEEPLTGSNPLLTLGHKAVLTPHLGASTEEAQVNVAIDVAEQIRDFFKTGEARSAVNIPLLRKELLEPVRDFMPMAETLGRFIRQLTDGPVSEIEIMAKGTLAEVNTSPLTLAILKGIFSFSREGVNYVNAPIMAKERGILVNELTSKSLSSYQNLIKIVVKTDHRSYNVAGTLISPGNFRIVEVDGHYISLEPSPHILLAPHHDRPGMIAGVSTILGKAQINVSALQVGRKTLDPNNEESMMLFNLDQAPSEDVIQAITQVDGVYAAKAIAL